MPRERLCTTHRIRNAAAERLELALAHVALDVLIPGADALAISRSLQVTQADSPGRSTISFVTATQESPTQWRQTGSAPGESRKVGQNQDEPGAR